MPTETFGEWADRVFPGLVPPAQVFNTITTETLREDESLTEEDQTYFLVVIEPRRPSKIEQGQSMSYSTPPMPTIRWIKAFDEEEAVAKAVAPLGAKVYVADRVNVATFDIPETPAPVRA